jgi:hypothetical protein
MTGSNGPATAPLETQLTVKTVEAFYFAFVENVLEHLLLAALAPDGQLPHRPQIWNDPSA